MRKEQRMHIIITAKENYSETSAQFFCNKNQRERMQTFLREGDISYKPIVQEILLSRVNLS